MRHRLVVPCMLLVAACGDAEKAAPVEEPAEVVTVSGTVTLPAGSALVLDDLVVATALGIHDVAADGSFTADVLGGPPSLVFVADGADRTVLIGYVDASGSGAGRDLGPRQAALALTYLSLGGAVLAKSHRQQALDELGALPEVAALRAEVEAQLAARPDALMTDDAALIASVTAVRDALRSDAPAIAEGALDAMQAALSEAVLILVEPSGQQSGLEVLNDPAATGIVVRNNLRRHARFAVYKTGWIDTAGNREDLVGVQQIGTFQDVFAVDKLSAWRTVTDALAGQGITYDESDAPPVELGLEAGSVTTFYEVVAVGPTNDFTSPEPPLFTDPRYVAEVTTLREQATIAGEMSFVFNILLPLFETVGITGLPLLGLQARLDYYGNLKGQLNWQELSARGQYARAAEAVLKGTVDKPSMREDLAQLVDKRAQQIRDLVARQKFLMSAQDGVRRLATSLTLLQLVTVAFEGYDIGRVIRDLGVTRPAEVWAVRVTQAPVKIEPLRATVTMGNPRASFTARVTPVRAGPRA